MNSSSSVALARRKPVGWMKDFSLATAKLIEMHVLILQSNLITAMSIFVTDSGTAGNRHSVGGG